jgi:exocyst complex protein 7
MALSEFTNAFDSVAADLERMYRGFKEGRGGAREAGVRDLVSMLLPGRVCADCIV